MDRKITEYQILFTIESGIEDFYTENKAEYDEKFQDLIDDDELQYVEQCIKKDYIWDDELNDWDEDDVEVLYNIENYDDYKDTKRASSLSESKEKPKYIVCSYYDTKCHGFENELKTDDWSETILFAHDKLMNGFMVEIENTKTGKYKRINPDEYSETFDGEFTVRPEELEESKDKNNNAVKKLAKYIVNHHKDITGLEPTEFNKIVQDVRDGKLKMTHKELGAMARKELADIKEFVKKYDAEHNTKLYTDHCMDIFEEIDNEVYKHNRKDEKYNVYALNGENNTYNSALVDTADTIEQAEDRVAELNAETGNNAYYEEADDWWEANSDRLIKYVANETPQVIADLVYNGNIDMYMQNTSKEIALDIYNQLGKTETENILKEFEKNKGIKTESKDTNRQLQQNYKKSLERELEKVQDAIANAGPGDISGLENRRDFIMDKLDQIDSDLSRKDESKENSSTEVENYHLEDMGGHTMAVFGKLKDGNYFAGNELFISIYDEDIWPELCEDDPDTTIWEQEHLIETLSGEYSSNREENKKYYDIISQTSFYSDEDLEWVREQLELDDELDESVKGEYDGTYYFIQVTSNGKNKYWYSDEYMNKQGEGKWFSLNSVNDWWEIKEHGYTDKQQAETDVTGLKSYLDELGYNVDDIKVVSTNLKEKSKEIKVEGLNNILSSKTESVESDAQPIDPYYIDKDGNKWDWAGFQDKEMAEIEAKKYKGAFIKEFPNEKFKYKVFIPYAESERVASIERKKFKTEESLDIEQIKEKVEIDITNAIYTYLTTKGYETEESAKEFIKDYVVIKTWYEDMTSASSAEILEKYLAVEVRAELDYDDLSTLSTYLDKVVQKYDASSYFDFVTGGIIRAYIQIDDKKLIKNESSSSVDKAKALLDLFNELYDGMGDMYAEDEWAELLASDYDLDTENMEADKIIITALNKMDDNAFKDEVDNFMLGLFENDGVNYLKDTLHVYPRNLKYIIKCLNTIKPYASESDKIDEVIKELNSVNMDLRTTAEEFQRYLHDNYKPWTVLGTTTGPRTYVNLFEVPTEYDIVGADYFNFANRPSDMLENIGYGWKQDGDKIVADLIGYTHSVRGSSVVYDQAPVKYGYSATIDSSNKESKFKEMANALISKAQEIKKEYKLESKKTEANVKSTNKALDYRLDNFDGVNIIVVDKKNGIDTEQYLEFDSMEFGIDEYEFKKSMVDGIRDILTNLYEFSDAYYEDVFTEDEINETANEITQDVLQLYDELPEGKIDRKNGYADLGESKKLEANMFGIAEDMYNRTHKDKWHTLSDDEKASYYNRNYKRIKKQADNLDKKEESIKITETVDTEQVKEDVETKIQNKGLQNLVDTEKELKDGIKKEIYQYTKQQGLDLEKLRKQGVELDSIADTIDKVVGDMVSKSAIEYMDQTGKNINWDFEIADNDISIITEQ